MADVSHSNAFGVDSYKDQMDKGKIETPSSIFPEDTALYSEQMLLWARYIYGLYSSGQTVIGPNGFYGNNTRPLNLLRAYARGLQPIEKYRETLDFQYTNGGAKWGTGSGADNAKSLLNISWDNVRIYSAFRERIIDRIMGVKYTPSVTAIDSLAIDKKKQNYLRDKLAADPKAMQFFAQAGMAPTNISQNAEMFSPEDIDTIEKLGGYSLQAEIELTEAVRNAFDLSRFDPVIKRQIVEDLVDGGIGASHVYHDPGTGRQIIEYVDIDRLLFRSSAYADCRDSDFVAFVKDMTIAGIRAESGFDEKTLLEIANTYAGQGGNTATKYTNTFQGPAQREVFQQRFRNGGPYDNSRIQVMTFYVVGLDVERYVVGIGARGGRIFDKVKRDSTLNRGNRDAGKEMVDYPVQYVYTAKWIVGTNYVYAVGRDTVTVRDGSPGAMRALLPVSIYAMNQPSITDSAVAIIDDLQLAILRRRSIMSKMPPPPNIAINISKMEDAIQLGEMNVTLPDLLDIYAIRGYLIYADRGEYDNGAMSQGSPITNLPDTTMQFMQTIQAEIEMSLNSLRMVTGTNEMSDGSAQAANVLNGVAQNFEASSNRALSMLYTASMSLSQSLCLQIARRYQLVCATGELKFTKLVPGSNLVKQIRLLPEYSVHDYDVTIKPMANDAFKQQVMNSLLQNRQNQLITEADYLVVAQMIDQDQMELAMFYLARAVKNMQTMQAQQQQQAMMAQSQAQAQAGVAMEEAKGQSEMMQSEAKGKLIILQGKVDDDNAQKQFEREKQLIILTKGLEAKNKEEESKSHEMAENELMGA